MKAYLIDPFAQTVTETSYDGDFATIAPAIDAQLFDVVRFAEKNGHSQDVFVDDEGLMVNPTEQAFFQIEGYPQPLAGKGLVLAGDPNTGKTVASDMTLEEVQAKVTFLSLSEVMMKAGLPGMTVTLIES